MKQKMTKKLIIIGLALFILSFGAVVWKAQAASMAARDYMNRNQGDISSGVTHEIIFTPTTNVSGGAGTNRLYIIFPDADDGKWCRTAGTTSLTAATTSLHDSATALPGTLSVTCTQGSGSSNYDTILVSAIDNLVAGTAYGVRISANAGALGTASTASTGIVTIKTNNGSSDVDTRSIKLALVNSDQVSVTGQVNPTLTFGISDNAIGFGTLTSAAARYATGDETGSASAPGNGLPAQISVSTNAQSGLVVEVRDENSASGSGMYNASPATTLTSRASSSIIAGTAGFGVYAKNSSGVTIAAGFDNNSSGDLAISTSFQTIVSAAAPVAAGTFDLSAIAAVAADTPPGDYADTITLVATGKF